MPSLISATHNHILTTTGHFWANQVKLLASNIRATVRIARRNGTVGMSRECLHQNVSTRGVSVRPDAFERLFDDAIKEARLPAGFLT